MRTVYKYPLRVANVQPLKVPKGAQFLHVGVQGEQLVLWASVDTAQPLETFSIAVVGTGQSAPEPSESYYLGTAHMPPFVWHVFVRFEKA